MVGTRSGTRRKEIAPQQTHQNSGNADQDNRYCPPFSSRYPRGESEAVPVQIAALASPLRSPILKITKTASHSFSLKAAKRVLNEPLPRNRDIQMLELQHCTSSPIGEDLVCENPVKDVKPTVSAGSPSWSGPSSEHPLVLDNLIMELTSQVQGPREAQQVAPQPASNQEFVVSHVEDIPEKSTTNYFGRSSQCLSTSFNITEFVKRQQDDTDDDPDEVQSALDPAFDCVNGYTVKKENAPLLRAIFEKYGDITRESEGKPPTIVSLFLERICAIYERLKGTKFIEVTRKDLNEMLDEVRFLESQKLNLRWLHEKLEYIHRTKMSSQNYLTVKQKGENSEAIIRSLENELEVHKREISLIEEKLVTEKGKADQIKKIALDIKARVDDLRMHSLVHGLL